MNIIHKQTFNYPTTGANERKKLLSNLDRCATRHFGLMAWQRKEIDAGRSGTVSTVSKLQTLRAVNNILIALETNFRRAEAFGADVSVDKHQAHYTHLTLIATEI